MPLEPLPVDDVLPDVLAALDAAGAVVLKAPTGAGKTTRVPPAVLDAGLEGEVIVLEPRRVAARAAARRIAEERGGRVGDEVGYQVRFDNRSSPATRIKFETDGVILRELQGDPMLSTVGALVFDEFHERHLYSDIMLGLASRLQDAK